MFQEFERGYPWSFDRPKIQPRFRCVELQLLNPRLVAATKCLRLGSRCLCEVNPSRSRLVVELTWRCDPKLYICEILHGKNNHLRQTHGQITRAVTYIARLTPKFSSNGTLSHQTLGRPVQHHVNSGDLIMRGSLMLLLTLAVSIQKSRRFRTKNTYISDGLCQLGRQPDFTWVRSPLGSGWRDSK